MVVSLFEETIFRGALLRGLQNKSNALTAIITTSAVYAAVHFIDYQDPAMGESINMLTAPAQFLSVYSRLVTSENYDAFLSLFMLGILLGVIRIRTDSIIQCIGIHAGLVAGIKIFRFLLEHKPENQFEFMVSSYDYRLGFMALIWLSLATLIYYFCLVKNN